MSFLKIQNVDLKGKRVFIRADLNVPIDESGKILDDSRIKASIETIKYAIQKGALVMVTSHLGRPEEGKSVEKFSLNTVKKKLGDCLNKPITLIKNWVDKPFKINDKEIYLLENCRFNVGEKGNDDILVKKMTKLCDVYVNDAFGTAHRVEATTFGMALEVKESCVGFLMARELENLKNIFENPRRPLLAIVGGSKISTKLTLLLSLLKKVDHLIVGGGIANTFLKARGFEIGKSIVEDNLLDVAKNLLNESGNGNGKIHMPIDVVVSNSSHDSSNAKQINITEVSFNEMILDVGDETSKNYKDLVMEANTIIWNGPLGLFEVEAFSSGTRNLARALSESSGFTAVGGGDTILAVKNYCSLEKINYISTGGGAFLEFLEGKELPAILSLAKNKI